MKKRNQSGQALPIILFVMAIALTIGLATVSRSITNIRISQQQKEYAKAFSAAEAGLEARLVGSEITSYGGFDITNPTVEELGGGSTFVFPEAIMADDTKTVWLSGSPTELTFYWGNDSSTGIIPALEATIIYESGGIYQTKKAAFDPDTRVETIEFAGTDPGGEMGGETFSYQAKFTDGTSDVDSSFPGGNLFAVRIKLLFNTDEAQILGVEATGGVLPVQATCYSAQADSKTTDIAAKVKQCQFEKEFPKIFDYVLFSEADIFKIRN